MLSRFPEMHIGIPKLKSCNQEEFKQSVWTSYVLIQNAEYGYYTILEIHTDTKNSTKYLEHDLDFNRPMHCCVRCVKKSVLP